MKINRHDQNYPLRVLGKPVTPREQNDADGVSIIFFVGEIKKVFFDRIGLDHGMK